MKESVNSKWDQGLIYIKNPKKKTGTVFWIPTKIMELLMKLHLHKLHTSFCGSESMLHLLENKY